jgi:DNA-binding MarR family transcriptional regulator
MPSDGIDTGFVAVAKLAGGMTVLRALDRTALRGKSVADLIESSPQWAGQLLKRLGLLGLVEQEEDPSDGRASLWRITDKGRAALLLSQPSEPATVEEGWILGLKLGATGKRVLALGLLEEMSPEHLYRVVGDLDFVAIAHSPDASVDLLADLRRRLHEAAHVEATHIGHIVSNRRMP